MLSYKGIYIQYNHNYKCIRNWKNFSKIWVTRIERKLSPLLARTQAVSIKESLWKCWQFGWSVLKWQASIWFWFRQQKLFKWLVTNLGTDVFGEHCLWRVWTGLWGRPGLLRKFIRTSNFGKTHGIIKGTVIRIGWTGIAFWTVSAWVVPLPNIEEFLEVVISKDWVQRVWRQGIQLWSTVKRMQKIVRKSGSKRLH